MNAKTFDAAFIQMISSTGINAAFKHHFFSLSILRKDAHLLVQVNSVFSTMKHSISKRLLRLPEVKHLTGLSKSTIYARISEDTFPRQIPLGSRTVVWLENDIQNWIAEQVSAARG